MSGGGALTITSARRGEVWDFSYTSAVTRRQKAGSELSDCPSHVDLGNDSDAGLQRRRPER